MALAPSHRGEKEAASHPRRFGRQKPERDVLRMTVTTPTVKRLVYPENRRKHENESWRPCCWVCTMRPYYSDDAVTIYHYINGLLRVRLLHGWSREAAQIPRTEARERGAQAQAGTKARLQAITRACRGPQAVGIRSPLMEGRRRVRQGGKSTGAEAVR